jgi:hypothetical protein
MKQPFSRDALKAAITPGVSKRAPIHGQRYRAFVVHPSEPGPLVLAIGHCARARYVVDLLRGGLDVAQSVGLLKTYGVHAVTGAVSDDDDKHAHAVAGLVNILSVDFPGWVQ